MFYGSLIAKLNKKFKFITTSQIQDHKIQDHITLLSLEGNEIKKGKDEESKN